MAFSGPSNNKKGVFHEVRRLSNGQRDISEHVGARGKTDKDALLRQRERNRLRHLDWARFPVGNSSRSKIGKNGLFTVQQVMGMSPEAVEKYKPHSYSDLSHNFLTAAASDLETQKKILPEYDDWAEWFKEDPEGAREAVRDIYMNADIHDQLTNLELLGILGNMATKSYPREEGKTPEVFGPAHDLLHYLYEREKDPIEPDLNPLNYEIYRTKYQAVPIRDEEGNIVDWSYDGATPVSDNAVDAEIFPFQVPKGKKITDLLPYIERTVSENEEDMVPIDQALPTTEMDYNESNPIDLWRDTNTMRSLRDFADTYDVLNSSAVDNINKPRQKVKDYTDQWSGQNVYNTALNAISDAIKDNADARELSKSPVGWALFNVIANERARRPKDAPKTAQTAMEDFILGATGFGSNPEDMKDPKATLLTIDDLAHLPLNNPSKWSNFSNNLHKVLSLRAHGFENGATKRDLNTIDVKNATKTLRNTLRKISSGAIDNEKAKGIISRAFDFGADADEAYNYLEENYPDVDLKDAKNLVDEVLKEREDSGAGTVDSVEMHDNNPYTKIPSLIDKPNSLAKTLQDYIEKRVGQEVDETLPGNEEMRKTELPLARRRVMNNIAKDIRSRIGEDGDKNAAIAGWLEDNKLQDIGDVKDYTDPAIKEEYDKDPSLQWWLNDVMPEVDTTPSIEVLSLPVIEVLNGKYKDESELDNASEMYEHYQDATRDKRVSDYMAEKGYADWQRGMVEDMFREQDRKNSLHVYNVAQDKHNAYAESGKKLSGKANDARIEKFMANNLYTLMNEGDPKAVLNKFREGSGLPGTLLQMPDGRYKKLISIDSDGTTRWQYLGDDAITQVEGQINQVREGLEPDERAEFDELLDSSLNPKGFDLSRITKGLEQARAARSLAQSYNRYKERTPEQKAEAEKKKQAHEDKIINNIQNSTDNMSFIDEMRKYGQYSEKYRKFLTEMEQQDAANDALARALDKQFDAKSKELGKAQEAVNSYNDEKARKAWDAFEEERRKTEENARKFSELRSSNIQLKRKNDEKERQNRGEKDAYDKMMGNYVTPLVAGMQYNAGTERDEREETVRKREEQQKQEAEKQKAKKEADKQAAEAERAKKEAEKQAAQAEQAKKAQETPPSKVQQQSAEAIRARKEAKTQQSQADDAALAEKHRAMVQNLMELGYSEEEAQAIVNKKTMQPKKPADSMTANNKPSIPEKKEEKDDNGISPNIAETMSGLSRGY